MIQNESDSSLRTSGAVMAASMHTGNPDVGIFIPYNLALYLNDLNNAVLYCFLAQMAMAKSPWGSREDGSPGSELALTYKEIAFATLLSEKAVISGIKHLVELEMLTVRVKQSAQHKWAPVNHYRCNFSKEAWVLDAWLDEAHG